MNDLMREEFEKWVLSRWPKTTVSRISADSGAIYTVGHYTSIEVQIAWESWQASRESLVVELPKSIEAYGSQGHHASDPDEALILEDVHAALTAAGVKYK